MHLIRKEQTNSFQNGLHCVAIEYPTADTDINGAVIELTGRYPDDGQSTNLVSKELAYVIEGEGTLFVNGTPTFLHKGDLVSIEPGEKFFWDGHLTLFVPCVPSWNHEQYRLVP